MYLPSRPTIDDGNVKVWTGKAISLLYANAGESPATGPVSIRIEDILHTAPVPAQFDVSSKSALDIAVRCSLDGAPLPAPLHAALAETFAADAVEAVRVAAVVAGPPKKPGKKPYDRAAKEAAAGRRLIHAEALLRAHFDSDLHSTATAWSMSGENGRRSDTAHFDRQSFYKYGSSGVASTCTAHDAREPADLVVKLVRPYLGEPVDGLMAAETAMTLAELAAVAQDAVARNGRRYLLRHLTNYEVLRAQGFPADHCNVLDRRPRKGPKMTEERARELAAFHTAEGRHYTEEELRSFVPVKKQYECAGNSVAVPCMAFALGRAVEVASIPLIDRPNVDIPDDGWAVRIAAHRRAGHDTLEALAKCLEEDGGRRVTMTGGIAPPPAANDNTVELGIIIAGLGCGEEDARAILALLTAA